MARINSKAKGARGELEAAEYLRERWGFLGARRGVQYRGGPDSPDVVGGIEGTHCEVKRCEKLHIYEALRQAAEESATEEVPYVLHRRNNMPWVVIVCADDLPRLALAMHDAIRGRAAPEELESLHG